MSFTDHKITAFAHRVADLPDEPQIPAADLKSRFDACPEELRVAHNAVCDDAARLEARVEGIVVDTFGDTIDKEMLSDELAAELDGKATQSALSAEAAARESADDALQSSISSVQTSLAAKCEVYFGTYTGDGQETQEIVLGFQPTAVYTTNQWGRDGNANDTYGGLVFLDIPSGACEITENGFRVTGQTVYCNRLGDTYKYIAFK